MAKPQLGASEAKPEAAIVMRDLEFMQQAVALAASVRTTTSPNPWVGCVIVTPAGAIFEGATQPPGGPHAEAMALSAARNAGADGDLRRAAAYVTLEPCSHHGRTPPCADALIDAGVERVVVGIEDPDPLVAGAGIAKLRAAAIDVEVGVLADEVSQQLAPYIKHRRTCRPWVVLKLAATLDGRTAAPDGSSRWITGREARADAHHLRAQSDAVLVGAGTVRADDPALTVRDADGRDPLRVVLGKAPTDAKVHPCLELAGNLDEVLHGLGHRGVMQLLVEGGASVASEFHRAGLVDRYVLYLAPAFFGGDDARPIFTGPGAGTVEDVWRGEIVDVKALGSDLRVDLVPAKQG